MKKRLMPLADLARVTDALTTAAATLGRKGGKAGRGVSKRRSQSHYSSIGKLGAIARAKNRESKS